MMKHSREYLKTVLVFGRLTICMTSPNISTSHLIVIKNRLAPEGTKRILSLCVPEFDSVKNRTPASHIDQ
jgi:hypothetical protein